MERWFAKEVEIEYWLRPYTGVVMVPGYRHVRHKNTRLFFEMYWQLLRLGFSEWQLADHAISRRWASRPALCEDVALAAAVYELAYYENLSPRSEFAPVLSNHPRDLRKGLK